MVGRAWTVVDLLGLLTNRGERLGELGTVWCWFAARCSPNSRLNVNGELHLGKGEDER